MKKYLNLILLGCSSLFGILIFATMAGAGVTFNGNSAGSYYSLMDNIGGTVATLVLAIITILIACALCALEVMKKTIGVEKFVACAGALFGLVTAILYFSTAAMANDASWVSGFVKASDGAGAVLSGIFSLITTFGLGAYSVKAFLKK